GADSIEISRDLHLDGLTPDFDLVRRTRDAVQLAVHVIIRPTARDFVYTEREVDTILDDARKLAQTGINGVVFGALTRENRLDLSLIERVAQAAAPLPLTVHRALDFSLEPEQALESVIGIAPRVLTGGPASTAWEARSILANWVSRFGDHLEFVLAGSLKLEQLADMRTRVRAPAYHFGSAARSGNSVDVNKVRALGAALRETHPLA
ncbi:MAG: copper homeostasis protein CutC, partial [Chloroflexota bacterium]